MPQQTNSLFSLRKNFSFMLLGNMIFSLSQWGILIILAKLGTSKMVGQFTLGLAVTAPIILLTDLQLRSALVTDAKEEHHYSDYFQVRIWMSFITFILFAVTILISNYSINTSLIVVVIGISKIIESFCDLNYGLFQKEEKMNWIARSLIIRGVLSFVVLGVCIWLTGSLLTAAIGLAVSWLFVLVFQDLPKSFEYERPLKRSNFKELKTIFIQCIPLGFVTMLLSLNINIPRYILEHYEGTEALGYYSAISYIMISGNILVTALGQSSSARLAAFYHNKQYNEFNKLVKFLLYSGGLIGLVGLIAAVTIGEPFLSIIYSKAYGKYHNLFTLIMLSGLFLYISSFLGYVLTAMRKFRIQPVLATAWFLVTFIASITLIPKYGLNGAAYAGIVSAIFQFITLIIVIYFEISKMKSGPTQMKRSFSRQHLGGKYD